MNGIELSSLTEDLHKVSLGNNQTPGVEIVDAEKRLSDWIKSIGESKYYEDDNLLDIVHRLPSKAFGEFTFDELCKFKHSLHDSCTSMSSSVEELFNDIPQYEVIRKINSSMWRWGYEVGTWNEVVDTYDSLRNFSLNFGPDFDIRLDYTTWYNQYGRSKYSRTYLDGIFAFLVYYKKKHVMTIGFSVIKGKRLLLQQVQLVKRFGNRFLYKLPKNYLEFVLDQFKTHFPHHQLFIVDGCSLIRKTIIGYMIPLKRERRKCAEYLECIIKAKDTESRKLFIGLYDRCLTVSHALEEDVVHLIRDRSRIKSFYNNVGKFTLGYPMHVSGLKHHQIA